MKNKYMKNGSLISNTDRSDKLSTHWFSLLDIHQKNAVFLLISFGIWGLKNFIITDESKIASKILFGL